MDADEQTYRRGLALIVAGKVAALNSPFGAEFVRVVTHRLAKRGRALGFAWRWEYSLEEATNIIVGHLLDKPGFCELVLDRAENAFAYTADSLIRWFAADADYYGLVHRDNSITMTPGDSPSDNRTRELPDHRDPFAAFEAQYDHVAGGGALLPEAIELTVATLDPRTPERIGQHLPEVVSWFAYNMPVWQGHESDDLADAADTFTDIHPAHLAAIANVTWGGRPNQATTSILGQYVKNRQFRPVGSFEKTLGLYKRRINTPHFLLRSAA